MIMKKNYPRIFLFGCIRPKHSSDLKPKQLQHKTFLFKQSLIDGRQTSSIYTYSNLLALLLWVSLSDPSPLTAFSEGSLCCLYTCTQCPALSLCTWVCWEGRAEINLVCVTSQRLKLSEFRIQQINLMKLKWVTTCQYSSSGHRFCES